MKKEPKFSIIIPVYNVENYLSQCLDSVINQTLLDIEIICVNDGTKDCSRYILEQYKKRDDRIQIVDKKNGGLSSARNAGIKVATGEYILFLDSDDYLSQYTCERLYYEVLEHHPEIIVFGGNVFPSYLKNDPWLTRNLQTRSVVYDDGGIHPLLKENGAHPFVWRDCFKREFLIKNKILFDESIRFAEDLIFQFMTFPLANQVIFISDKLYYYRWIRPNSLMANAAKDLYQKYMYHIDALYIIAEFWNNRGLLKQYTHEFMAWTVSFMGWDLYNYQGEGKSDLINQLYEFWEKYELQNATKRISTKGKIYYKYIKRYNLKR